MLTTAVLAARCIQPSSSEPGAPPDWRDPAALRGFRLNQPQVCCCWSCIGEGFALQLTLHSRMRNNNQPHLLAGLTGLPLKAQLIRLSCMLTDHRS